MHVNYMTQLGLILTGLAGLGLAAAQPVSAAPIAFSGSDIGAGPTDPRPNSNTAASAFDTASSAMGVETLINFESAPLGAFTSLNIAPGVVLTGTDSLAASQTIQNTPVGPPAPSGYNTTAGGANFLYVHGGTATFTFAAPIKAFGGYFTGVQIGGESLGFNDGTSRFVSIPSSGPTGGVAFVGFTDASQQITSVTVSTSVDFIGVDDVRFVPSASVPDAVVTPESSGLANMMGALLALGGLVVAAKKKAMKKAKAGETR